MGWPFGKKPRAEWRDKPQAITSAIPRDDDRAGPVPPPPRTAHAPGVAIHAFGENPVPRLLRLDSGIAGFFLEGEEGRDRSSALLVLFAAGAGPGGGLTVLRLGPPPGARWVFVGLHAIAVFAGKVTLVDGEDPKIVPAGHLALVGDPTATLALEAGNDSALAVALGRGDVVSALG
jgi:hypothetical protein